MNEEVLILYADVYAFLNFALDFLCLWIAGRIAGRTTESWRVVLGALFGAAYGIGILLVKGVPVWVQVGCHLLAAGGMVLIAFGFRGVGRFGKRLFVFLMTEAAMGGVISACFAVGQREVSAVGVLVLASLSAVLVTVYGYHCRRKVERKEMKIEVQFGGQMLKLDTLVDSGNLLTEPFSALPVVVLSANVMPGALKKPDPENSPVPLRAIPVRTGTGLGLLYGFVPDSVTLLTETGKKKKVDAVIGIDTECRDFCGKDGLLPASLLD